MGNASSTSEGDTSFLESTTKQLLSSNTICGNIFDAVDEDHDHEKSQGHAKSPISKMILPGELCHSSKSINNRSYEESIYSVDETTGKKKVNPTSALFARALISEVTDNPRTMNPVAMAAREKRLLKAQDRARRQRRGISALAGVSPMGGLNLSFANSTAASDVDSRNNGTLHASVLPPNQLSENRAQLGGSPDMAGEGEMRRGKHTVTIGLSLSRRHSTQGHPDTVTRQTAFDFNELQDRSYKYVSSTDSSGWRAGGGEVGGNPAETPTNASQIDENLDGDKSINGHAPTAAAHKVAAPDTVHIPIIHIDAASPAAVDQIIAALARGEVFIPHMSILPEALSVNGVSPPDLVVRFGCERNDDLPPDEWPNWCLEFMHNQLYEYFLNAGARWTKRPFQITLAKKVRWRTVKHMNKFFAHSERVINAWREKGPQYLNPQLSYIEGGATPEEVARPHGIYLLRNGRPTNYFAPNFEPPYTTKMTRSLLMNVIGNSWDKKRRDWTSEPIPRVVTPAMLIATVCGCGDGGTTGFIASEDSMIQQEAYLRENLMKGRIGEVVVNVNEKHEKLLQQKLQQAQNQQKQQQQSVDKEYKSNEIVKGDSKQNKSKEKNKDKSRTDLNNKAKSWNEENNKKAIPLKKTISAQSKNSLASDESRGIHIVQERQPNATMPSEGSSSFSRSNNTTSPGQKSPKTSGSNSAQKKNDFFHDVDEDKNLEHDKNLDSNNDQSLLSPKNLKNHDRSSALAGRGAKSGNSVGESATTIPISNQWTKTSKEGRDRDREIAKRLGELEAALRRQKLEATDLDDEYYESEEEQFTEQKSNNKKERKEKEKREKKERKRKEKEKERERERESREKEKEKERERERVREREKEKVKEKENIKKEKEKERERERTRLQFKNGRSSQRHRSTSFQSINKSPSNHSLDYSLDSATIASGHYTADGSVATAGNQSLISYVTRSTIHSLGSEEDTYRRKQQLEDLLQEGDEEDDESDSLIHSTGDQDDEDEDIPSDADLFAIGWAKALDENSGSYYYFTLDRSQIVWENPLLSEEHATGNVPIPNRTFSSETESYHGRE